MDGIRRGLTVLRQQKARCVSIVSVCVSNLRTGDLLEVLKRLCVTKSTDDEVRRADAADAKSRNTL
jgi:hypothetical protein